MRTRTTFAVLLCAAVAACADFMEPEPAPDNAAVDSARPSSLTLSFLGGAEAGSAQGINDLGHVVGWVEDGEGRMRAFLWRDGAMEALPGLGGESSSAEAINRRGEVAGHAENEEGELRAVVWRNGEPEALGTLGGTFSFATGINDRGEVVGVTENGAGQTRGFLWSNGRMTSLEPPSEGTISRAMGINDRGAVVGWVAGGSLAQDGALWQNGRVTRLRGPALEAVAADINNHGRIVGSGFEWVPGPPGMSGYTVVALAWAGEEPDVLVPAAELGWTSSALAINDRGQVVGRMQAGFQAPARAFLWEAGSVRELDAPDGVPSTAWDLNARGAIVGEAGGPVMWASEAGGHRSGIAPAGVAQRRTRGETSPGGSPPPAWAGTVCAGIGVLPHVLLGVEVAAGC